MPIAERRPPDVGGTWLAAGAGVLAFFVYAPRLCRSLSLIGDSAELVTAAALWGVPHPPGYPLFTAIGHLFTWLPVHELPWRVHLTSAIFHAGAVGMTVAATLTVTKSRLAALAAGCALALERSFFLGSLYAEVFPLNDLLFAALLALAFRLRAEGAAAHRGPLFAAVAGVALAHHLMITLAAPALALLVVAPLRAESRPRGRAWLALAVAFVAPFLVYALVPIAASSDPALSWGDVHDLRSFLALVTRQDYGGLFSPVHGSAHATGWAGGAERALALGNLLVAGFGVPTVVVAAAGFASLLHLRATRTVGVSLLLAAFASGPFFAWVNALGTETEGALAFFARFTTMCTVPIAIAFGAGVAALKAAIPSAGPSAVATRTLAGVALAAWAVHSFVRVEDLDLRNDDRGIAFAHDLILPTPDRALILLSGDAPASAGLYVCAVERACGDRIVLPPGRLFLPWAMAQTRRRHPDLDIPWAEGPALKHVHELALAAAGKRPVLAYPDLLEKDPLLASSFNPVPHYLLFQLFAPDVPAAATDEAFLASACALAGVEPCPAGAPSRPCEGCLLAFPRAHPSQEVELALAYGAAARNHARFATQLPAARELIAPLLARAAP